MFHEKSYCSHAHILSQYVHSIKNSSKPYCFHVILFHLSMKNPLLSIGIFSQKTRQFCQNYLVLWAKKALRWPFFLIFHKKLSALMQIFCQKTWILKKILWFPYFVRKTSILSKHIALMSFFQTFHEKSPAVMPIFGKKKTSVLSKLHYILGQKS